MLTLNISYLYYALFSLCKIGHFFPFIFQRLQAFRFYKSTQNGYVFSLKKQGIPFAMLIVLSKGVTIIQVNI